MKTIADTYIEEDLNKGIAIGEARGIEQSILKIARRMLQENTNIKLITSVTGLSTDDILKIQNKLQVFYIIQLLNLQQYQENLN